MRLTNALPMDDGLALRDVADFDGEVAIDVDLFVVAARKGKKFKNISELPFSTLSFCHRRSYRFFSLRARKSSSITKQNYNCLSWFFSRATQNFHNNENGTGLSHDVVLFSACKRHNFR